MAGTRWLSADEQRVWRSFVGMQTKLQAQLSRQMQTDSALSMADFEVLVALSDRSDARVRPFELVRELQWEKSRLSHHLTRMAARGLVARESCSDDGRGAFVVMTDAGRAAIEQAAPGHVDEVRRVVFDPLTPAQLAALASISDTVVAQLDACPSEDDAPCPSGDASCPDAAVDLDPSQESPPRV